MVLDLDLRIHDSILFKIVRYNWSTMERKTAYYLYRLRHVFSLTYTAVTIYIGTCTLYNPLDGSVCSILKHKKIICTSLLSRRSSVERGPSLPVIN
jgi:hypothetical protein